MDLQHTSQLKRLHLCPSSAQCESSIDAVIYICVPPVCASVFAGLHHVFALTLTPPSAWKHTHTHNVFTLLLQQRPHIVSSTFLKPSSCIVCGLWYKTVSDLFAFTFSVFFFLFGCCSKHIFSSLFFIKQVCRSDIHHCIKQEECKFIWHTPIEANISLFLPATVLISWLWSTNTSKISAAWNQMETQGCKLHEIDCHIH